MKVLTAGALILLSWAVLAAAVYAAVALVRAILILGGIN